MSLNFEKLKLQTLVKLLKIVFYLLIYNYLYNYSHMTDLVFKKSFTLLPEQKFYYNLHAILYKIIFIPDVKDLIIRIFKISRTSNFNVGANKSSMQKNVAIL